MISKYEDGKSSCPVHPTLPFPSDNDNDNDNDDIIFDHNLQIEITIYNNLETQIINKLVWRLLLRQNNLLLA